MTQILERKVAVRDAKARAYLQQRIGDAATNLSRRGDLAAKVELANEAICNFISKVYTREPDGEWVYIDPITYRILIVKPWGDSGWKTSGLLRSEARTVSRILMSRVRRGDPVLFDFNSVTREWYLNLALFRSYEAAISYTERFPIRIKEWREVSNAGTQKGR